MHNLRAVWTAAMRYTCVALAGALLVSVPARADWNKPWKSEDRALVIDAYEFNPIDWKALTQDKRIAGFINKASDGLPPEWKCSAKNGDEEMLCKNRWWKYSVTKELYMTRREMAKTLGLKWGAYHLGRPGNPREQADHFVDFAEPEADELIALDIEDNTSEWMSLADAEIFARQIKIRTGRYPVLYTNGSTAKWISDYKDKYTLLSRLPLWYARYRDDITGMFPQDTWPTYALWQFSSMHNCTPRNCPYRVKGAKSDIDVNVSPYDVAGLRAAWPFDQLVAPKASPSAGNLVADLREGAGRLAASLSSGLLSLVDMRHSVAGEPADEQNVVTAENGSTDNARTDRARTDAREDADIGAPTTPVDPEPSAPAVPIPASQPAAAVETGNGMLAAYGPAVSPRRHVDPLKLLTAVAVAERSAAAKADATADAHAKAADAPALVPVPDDIVATTGLPMVAASATAAPEKSVEIASLGPIAAMQDEMKAVAAIVPEKKTDRDAAIERRSANIAPAWTGERSKVRQWLEAAEACKVQGNLAMPALALSQSARGREGRGPRLAALLRPAENDETASADSRIVSAFCATR